MLALLGLPVELLGLIFEHTPPTGLRDLCQTCKYIHDLAMPVLYHSIRLEWDCRNDPSIVMLLRSLVGNSHLSCLVKSLELDGDDPLTFDWDKGTPPSTSEGPSMQDAVQLIHDTQMPHAKHWEDSMKESSIGAIAALLLMLLPNLTSLYLSELFIQEPLILKMSLNHELHLRTEHGPLPTLLRPLRNVTLIRGRSIQHVHPAANRRRDLGLCLFHLPDIRYIDLDIDHRNIFSWLSAQPPRPLHLQSLKLRHMREERAREIFEVCWGLRRLEWTVVCVYGDEREPSLPYPDSIMDSLCSHHTTLDGLTLQAACIWQREPVQDPIAPNSSPISRFAALRKLTITWGLLLGPNHQNTTAKLEDLLPLNIETLIITDDMMWERDDFDVSEDDILDVLRDFLNGDRKISSPRLYLLELRLEHTDSSWDPVVQCELERLGEATGLLIQVIDMRIKDENPEEYEELDWQDQ